MARTIIGIMGPGEKATEADLRNANEIGGLCAQHDYLVMTGGRPLGVMEVKWFVRPPGFRMGLSLALRKN